MDTQLTLIACEIPKPLDLVIHNQKSRSAHKQTELLEKYNHKRIEWSIRRFESNTIIYQTLDDGNKYGPAPQFIIPRDSLDNWFTFEIAQSIVDKEAFSNFSYSPQQGDQISFTSTFVYKSLKNVYRSEPRYNVMSLTFDNHWTLDKALRLGESTVIKTGLLVNS